MATQDVEGRNDRTRGQGLLIILTLKKHIEGIWITKLVERLKQSVPTCSSVEGIDIGIRALEDWLAKGWLISEIVQGQKILGIVNRVSDAANPALFKACCALLAAAEESLKIPVWNGSSAYALCGNKWRHHILFRQAKLSSPTTMVYYTGQDCRRGDFGNDKDYEKPPRETTINIETQMFRQNASGRIEILVKANAGGFGAGIKRISLPMSTITSSSDTTNAKSTAQISIPSSFQDDMALVQQYETPKDGNIYRVWFLNGKVQCAVKRKVKGEGEENDEDNTNSLSSATEFTSGCAGGNLCKLSLPKNSKTEAVDPTKDIPSVLSNLRPWEVPREVRHEIEDQLLPLLTDAHCGSVEFLYSSCSTTKAPNVLSSCSRGDKSPLFDESLVGSCGLPRRLYFDLNLLSTLPIIENMDSIRTDTAEEFVWPHNFDPWLELAHGIWDFLITDDMRKNISSMP